MRQICQNLSEKLDILKQTVYYSAIYEFRGLKAFYAAYVRDIEICKKKGS